MTEPAGVRLRHLVVVVALTALASGLAVGGVEAQAQSQVQRAGQPAQVAAPPPGATAEQVRQAFLEVLKQYSPLLGALLKLDPSLMASEEYLAPYPALQAFLSQHPEVRRNPSYYLEPVRSSYGQPYYDPASQAWRSFMEMLGVLIIVSVVLVTFGWLVRTAIDYRRWGRLAKVQAEAHTKLLDRFTANDELLAYVQSPAGSRFLQSAPIALDGTARPMAAPIGRILWSMQAGVVLAAAGLGLSYASGRVDAAVAGQVFTFGAIVLAVGIGFALSSVLAFVLTKRLGLLESGGTPESRE